MATLGPVDSYSVNTEDTSTTAETLYVNGLPVDGGAIDGVAPCDLVFDLVGEINGSAINDKFPVDGDYSPSAYTFTPVITTAGIISNIVNLVGPINSGRVITITETVNLRVVNSGVIASVINDIRATNSGVMVNIRNRVLDSSTPSFFTRNGWDFSIYIKDLEITHDIIMGDVRVNKASNTNTTIEFTVKVSDPVTFIDSVYDGAKEVVVDYYDGTESYRLATSLVDSPIIDLLGHKVTLKCSNQRNELIESKMSSIVKTIGRYNKPVQGDFNSVTDELNLRLKTVPMDIDFDSHNNISQNLWQPKNTADFLYQGNDIYRRVPSIDWQNRGDVVNTYVVNLVYKHTRLYHMQLGYSWTAPYYGNSSDYATNLYTAPSVSMINNAIAGTSWKKVNDVSYTEVYPQVANWFGIGYSSTMVTFTDTSGATITDSKGDVLYQAIPDATRNDLHVMQASWNAAIRFSQYLQDTYQLTIQAPQSITKNGVVTQYQDVNYSDDYDASDWEQFKKITPKPSNATTSNNSYYLNIDEFEPGALNKAILTCIDMGRTEILSTHRNTLVVLQCKWLKPEVELSHTIEIDAPALRDWPKLQCKGKVVKIEHKLDCVDGDRQTEITLALYRVPGTVTPTPIVIPTQPTYTPTIPSSAVVLGNHYGQVPVDGTVSDAWNGFIGNKAVHVNLGFFNSIPYTVRGEFTDIFRVDTPAVPDSLRSLQNLQVSATYDILIPNDPLDITL